MVRWWGSPMYSVSLANNAMVVVPGRSVVAVSSQWNVTVPFSLMGTPRLSRYQAAKRTGSLERRKTPPIPVTRATRRTLLPRATMGEWTPSRLHPNRSTSPCAPTLLAARNARACSARIAELENTTHELTMTIGGRQRWVVASRLNVVQPHDHRHVLGMTAQATGGCRGGDAGRAARRAGLAGAAVRRAGRGAAAGRPTCSRGRGATPSTRPRFSGSPSRCSRPRSTRRAS